MWFSFDRSMEVPPHIEGIDRCYLVLDDEDEPPCKALVFRDWPRHKSKTKRTKAAFDSPVCPYEDGIERKVKKTCSKCKRCWSRAQVVSSTATSGQQILTKVPTVGRTRKERLMDKPNAKWSLEQLADYIKSALKRSAEDAWRIGEALAVAHKKHKEKRDWLRWLREETGLKRMTAYRYLDLHTFFKLKEVEAKPLTALYRFIEGKRREERVRKAAKSKDAGRAHKKASGGGSPRSAPTKGANSDEIVLEPPGPKDEKADAHRAIQQRTPDMPPPVERLEAQAAQAVKKHRKGETLSSREIKVAIKQLDRAKVAEVLDFSLSRYCALLPEPTQQQLYDEFEHARNLIEKAESQAKGKDQEQAA
jgi:hypothetical protein